MFCFFDSTKKAAPNTPFCLALSSGAFISVESTPKSMTSQSEDVLPLCFFILILFLLVGLLLHDTVISLYILIKTSKLVSTMFESTIRCIRMGGCPFPHNLNSFGQYLSSFLPHFFVCTHANRDLWYKLRRKKMGRTTPQCQMASRGVIQLPKEGGARHCLPALSLYNFKGENFVADEWKIISLF